MITLKEGDKAPAFSGKDQNGNKVSLADYKGKKVIVYYRVAWVFAIFFGAVLKISLVWNISDAANALMAIPNLIMVLMLSGVIAKETRKYLWDNNLDTVDTEMVR